MRTAPDFWHSKSTWNALAAVVSTVATRFLDPGLVPVVVAVYGFLQMAFLRDAIVRHGGRKL